ncbi:MAG: AmmeMemoRadiSam system protein A, partial [Candidatus Krumholzibacteria bacterium]|nr:AmmeMemoRadiSam system protein A [Candidatus Krumholzibacteria bacterium]
LVRFDAKGHEARAFGRSEHALEVQLPFLQVALGDFKLVPIVMGDQSAPVAEALGKALGEALRGRNVLIVASTDLSHFHEDEEARGLDGDFQKRLALFDPEALLKALASKSVEACGGGPVVSAMMAARSLGATKCTVLMYANSGDVTGDRSSVVGYLSAAMVKEKQGSKTSSNSRAALAAPPAPARDTAAGSKTSKPRSNPELTRDDKVFLLKLARSAIEAECRGTKLAIAPSPSPIMREPRGAFVTLKKAGQLRGCIGYIEAIKPLAATIEEMAKAAAFSDLRFNPVRTEEIPDLEIEISVLSPLSEVRDPSTVVVGTHGLIVSRGSNRGVLLPQVPTEWGWDRETFLAQTCAKAGLPEGAWKEKGTRIESFTADVFSERELGLRK